MKQCHNVSRWFGHVSYNEESRMLLGLHAPTVEDLSISRGFKIQEEPDQTNSCQSAVVPYVCQCLSGSSGKGMTWTFTGLTAIHPSFKDALIRLHSF